MGLLILLAVFAICVVIGMPVAFALGVAAVTTFFFEGLPIMIAFQRIISGISIYALMAIPFFITGMRMEPRAEISAMAEPEIPPNNIDENTLTMPSPPRTAPTAEEANLTSRMAIPP